jgi:hypothetical protein
MFNFFKKTISKKEENKVTISKIEIIKYKKLIKAIVGNRGDTLYKFIDEYNNRTLKNIDVEIRSTILKHHTYDTPDEFEIDLFNTYFSELALMYLESKGYMLSVDWKGEENSGDIEQFVNSNLTVKGEKIIYFDNLQKLSKRIKDEGICIYDSDFLLIKLKLIDTELKERGYSLYLINDNSDTYHIFLAKTGVITEDEKIINFWAADVDDYQHNGLGRKLKAGIAVHKISVMQESGKKREIIKNTMFFINEESETELEIETISCEDTIKGKIINDNLNYEIIS